MSFIPKSLLRKLYVKGSLESVDLTGDGSFEGFKFKLKNVLATGTLIAPFDISIDGEKVSHDNLEAAINGEKVDIKRISSEKPSKVKSRQRSRHNSEKAWRLIERKAYHRNNG